MINSVLLNRSRNGSALILACFASAVAVLIVIGLMDMASINVNQITDDRVGKTAFYAAEAGLEYVKNEYNQDNSLFGKSLSSTDIPTQGSPYDLTNGSKFWISNIQYDATNTSALVDIVGNSGDSYRKIRSKIVLTIPSVFNDYGLLTDGVLTIHGSKVLKMSVHANNGLSFSGSDTLQNNAVATQSNNPNAGAPNATTNPIGGYIPNVDVPVVPVAEYRTKSQSEGHLFTTSQANLTSLINATPANSNVYIQTSTTKISKNIVTLYGNMQNRFIFIDGDATLNIAGSSNLSNVMIASSGKLAVNGSVDIGTSHQDQLDVVFANAGDVTLNGSRSFQSLFWSNGCFTQNGASLSGRVIAQDAIFLNGSFILTNSNKLSDNNAFDRTVSTSTWQLIPMN